MSRSFEIVAMRKLLVLSFFIASQVSASGSDLKMSKIVGADLVCEEVGEDASEMFAFDLTKGSERVWQADKGGRQGFEQQNVEVQPQGCGNCYDVKVANPFAKKIKINFEIRQNGSNDPIKAIGTIKLGILKLEGAEFTCHEVN